MGIIVDPTNFYSPAPRGARHGWRLRDIQKRKFLLTRPSRGATAWPCSVSHWPPISTHTPLAGRDFTATASVGTSADFYSHAPRGARQMSRSSSGNSTNFYSHAPRGARHAIDEYTEQLIEDFYSHAPRGARRSPNAPWFTRLRISTHTPLAGRDRIRIWLNVFYQYFYSHAPRGARRIRYAHMHYMISIFLLTRPSRGATRTARTAF